MLGSSERAAALAALFDETTERNLTRVGAGAGWRCWEVGAGGGSIARWLAARGARVLATDIVLDSLDAPGCEVRRHAVGTDPPPDGPFDLVHARLVLTHVPARDRAIADMAAALAPGGWLVLEDADPGLQPLAAPDAHDDAAALANRIRTGFRALLTSRGADLAFGRTLPRRLRDAGLRDVGADAWFPLAHPACARLELASLADLRSYLLDGGVCTADELDRYRAALAAGALDLAQPPLISAWGRR